MSVRLNLKKGLDDEKQYQERVEAAALKDRARVDKLVAEVIVLNGRHDTAQLEREVGGKIPYHNPRKQRENLNYNSLPKDSSLPLCTTVFYYSFCSSSTIITG